jgi:DNA helicase HerA-like ATPase
MDYRKNILLKSGVKKMEKSMAETETKNIDVLDYNELEYGMSISNDFVNKNYLSELTKYPIVPIPSHIQEITVRNNIRLFKLTKIVYDKGEHTLDKFASVFHTLTNVNGSLIMIVDSNGHETSLYLGVRSSVGDQNIHSVKESLEKSFLGHFPGSELDNLKNPEIEELLHKTLDFEKSNSSYAISIVSGIPSLKDPDKKSFVQGMEKLIEAMKGESFTAIFISDPINNDQLESIKSGYEQLYTQLVPFAKTELGFSVNDSHAVTKGISTGFTETINQSVTKTQSYTSGTSETESKSTTKGRTRSAGAGLAVVGGTIGSIFGPLGSFVGGTVGGMAGAMIGSTTNSEAISRSTTTNQSNTIGESETEGTSVSNSITNNESETSTIGNSQSLQLSFENKTVTNLLLKIDEQLERLNQSADFGMWNTACYFIAPSQQTAQVAASTFKAMMRGNNSAIEKSYINTWTANDQQQLLEMGQYLHRLSHPLIDLTVDNGLKVPHVTPGSLLSGLELAIPFHLPKKSVSGLPVIEMAEFGRNISTYKDTKPTQSIKLGHIFHMGKAESTTVDINLQSLSMHTFVTGATGSGKSNTIYYMLQELNRKRIKFLVIEPAKGEYKKIFGGKKNVQVFGTNPKYTKLLKINPFRFPEEVHVLEHIDRLVEMFNACWPMYAAMPAVLKDAIEQAYEMKGWDLDESIHYDEIPVYPTFQDVLKILPSVIEQSSYSEELKGNYTGALVTRIRSLTNGIIGRVFSDDEVDNTILFDRNCIVDISRIGSVETKSLIMGILFMRLQEHRQAFSEDMNSELKHVTVLEEAHHLMRRSSQTQSQEGANLQGKSVEMISSAIAEMRTYGEGFIITDQSPNLLDQSVIRNTNTKIILRLPDMTDRQDVGLSASLNQDQINELPKLKTGVAVVYQNDWLEPVLCSINHYEQQSSYEFIPDMVNDQKELLTKIIFLLLSKRVHLKDSIALENGEIEAVKRWVETGKLRNQTKNILLQELNRYHMNKQMELWNPSEFRRLSEVVFDLLNGRSIIQLASNELSIEDWNAKIFKCIRKKLSWPIDTVFEFALTQCILQQQAREKRAFEEFYFSWVEKARVDLKETSYV